MKVTWRWFGPRDAITIDEIMQIDSQGIITALHHISVGDTDMPKLIAARFIGTQTALQQQPGPSP